MKELIALAGIFGLSLLLVLLAVFNHFGAVAAILIAACVMILLFYHPPQKHPDEIRHSRASADEG